MKKDGLTYESSKGSHPQNQMSIHQVEDAYQDKKGDRPMFKTNSNGPSERQFRKTGQFAYFNSFKKVGDRFEFVFNKDKSIKDTQTKKNEPRKNSSIFALINPAQDQISPNVLFMDGVAEKDSKKEREMANQIRLHSRNDHITLNKDITESLVVNHDENTIIASSNRHADNIKRSLSYHRRKGRNASQDNLLKIMQERQARNKALFQSKTLQTLDVTLTPVSRQLVGSQSKVIFSKVQIKENKKKAKHLRLNSHGTNASFTSVASTQRQDDDATLVKNSPQKMETGYKSVPQPLHEKK